MPTTYKRLTSTGLSSTIGSQGVIPGHRVNLAPRPAIGTGASFPWQAFGWSNTSTQVTNPSLTGLSARASATSGSDTNLANFGVTLTAGTYTYSVWVFLPSGSALSTKAISVYPEMNFVNWTTIASNFGTIPVNTWTRLYHTFRLESTINYSGAGQSHHIWMTHRYDSSAGYVTNGSFIYFDAPLMEVGTTVGEYFDDRTPGAYRQGEKVIMPNNLRRNYVYNPSFENNLEGWVITSGTRIRRMDAGENNSLASEWALRCLFPTNSTGAFYHSAQTDIGGSGAYFAGNLIHNLWGKTVTASVDVRTITPSTGHNRVGLQMVWFDGDGNYISESSQTAPPATSGTFTRIQVANQLLPMNARAVTIRFFRDGPGVANAAEYHLDNFQLEESSTYDGTYFDGNRPGCDWTGSTHQSSSVYNPIEVGGYNMCRNTGSRLPNEAGHYQVTVAQNSGLPLFGSSSLAITGNAGSNNALGYYAFITIAELPRVANGTDTFTLSFYMFSGATLAYKNYLNMHNSSYTYLNGIETANFTTEGGKWTRHTHVFRPTVGTKYVYVHWASDAANFNSGFQLNVNGYLVNEGGSAQEWFNGNSTNGQWVGGASQATFVPSFRVAPVVTPGSMTTAYQVPSGTQAVVSTINIANTGASPATVRVAARPSGTTLANQHFLAFDLQLDKGESKAITEGITLGANDLIEVQAANSPVAVNVFGTEIS
jgi:hypothetical protein